MLNFLSAADRTCEGLSRRSFLQIGALGGLGVSLPAVLAATRARAGEAAGAAPADVNCILVWARGGTSHACCAMNSFRQSFWTVPPILLRGTPRASASAM